MANKIFKTLDQQIEILKAKGLTINDENFAKKILFRENYYFLTGYRHLFVRMPKTEKNIKENNF